MATPRKQASANTQPPQLPQASPSQLFGAAPLDASFVWQQLAEIQKGLGGVQAALDTQLARLDKLEADAEKTYDKINAINYKLIAASAVGAVVVLVGGWVFKEVWDVAKPALVQKLTAAPAVAAPANPATPAKP